METKNCFICNRACFIYNKNLFEIKSKHTETRLSDFVVKILGDFPFKREYSVECDDNLVCSDCLNKVNEYDLACLTSKRVEDELRALLVETAMSLAGETDASVEPMHQLFTESTEATELKNDIKTEESNFSDFETIVALDKEPQGESEIAQNTRNKHRTVRIIQRKEPKAKANCYTCQTCNLSFNTNSLYEQHKKEHKEEEDPFKCQHCALELLDEMALAVHKELHEKSSSPFRCVICEKMFKAKAALVRHMRIHSGLKFYQCERCGKEFVHKSSFQMHILSHDDIRKKKCETCQRMFRSSSHLNRHLRIHTGAKPWSCEICNQRFAQRYNMTVHRRLHNSNSEKGRTKDHLCNFCGSTFARKSKLEEHLQKSHEAVTPHTAIGNNLTEKRQHLPETITVK